MRPPAVAGSFYPVDAGELRRLIASFVERRALAGGVGPRVRSGPLAAAVELNQAPTQALALIAPHAGFIYSGAIAGAVYSSVVLPDTFVILAPSHRPLRSKFAIMTEGEWETPLGTVPVASDLAVAIQAGCPTMISDPEAHRKEHSLEVQIPFIQYFRRTPSIVPINVSSHATYAELAEAGESIAAAIRTCGREVLIVASTDMSHYISAEDAKVRDGLAIERILALDPRGLVETVFMNEISMCGVLPTAAALVAAGSLGAIRADLIAYATSGDVTGDTREVVGYAGLRLV